MTSTRSLARPLLATVFITAGIDTLRNPGPRAATAKPVIDRLAAVSPMLSDPERAVRLNAGVQVGAGALLALGRLPRLSAALLLGSLAPTTIAGHRFWDEDDTTKRKQQQLQFLKNLSIGGGLVLAVFDTGGAPSLGWRARRRLRRAARTARHLSASAHGAARSALDTLPVG